jgi:hypothetical protein
MFKPPEERRNDHHHITVRPMPKYIFLYPTFVTALVVGIMIRMRPEEATSGALIFLAIVSLNLMVLALDFPRGSVVALVSTVVAIGLLLMLIDLNVMEFLPKALSIGRNLSPVANDQFYFTLAAVMGLLFGLVLWVDVRLNYWRVMPNEIIHHHGVWDSVQRYPAPGLMMQKDITDVFEYWLLHSGRLTIHPTEGPDIILENVPNIDMVERRIQTLLEAMSVTVSNPMHHDHAAHD